jgi:hypothetical protein
MSFENVTTALQASEPLETTLLLHYRSPTGANEALRDNPFKKSISERDAT